MLRKLLVACVFARAMAESELCKLADKCTSGEAVTYPGSTFFIDPDNMTPLQLLFVFLTYGYVLYVSADMIGDGAELLLLVPGYADFVGPIVLPVLGAVPDGMMVLFSGVGPIEVAQENVAVGVGALAGSTIMLLTLPWILSVYAGGVDMQGGQCVGYSKSAKARVTPGGGIFSRGIEFEDGVRQNARLMLVTSLSYVVVQIPAYMIDNQKTSTEMGDEFIPQVAREATFEKTYVGVAFVVTVLMFALYMYLQWAATKEEPPVKIPYLNAAPVDNAPDPQLVAERGLLPLIQHYREDILKGRIQPAQQGGAAAQVAVTYLESIEANQPLNPKSTLPKTITSPLKTLFTKFANKTQDKGLHQSDMRDLLHTLGLAYAPKEFADHFEKADKDKGGFLDYTEFIRFFEVMICQETLPYEKEAPKQDAGGDDDGGGEDDDEEEMPEEFKNLDPAAQKKAILLEAFKKMTMGTILVLLFSDPMVDVLSQIGKMTGVPAFYVSFILAPLASNASELLCSMKLAGKRTKGTITQSLQTLEGAACMNNTFCLGIFFALMYYQGLAWKFTAETLTIIFVQVFIFCVVMSSNIETMVSGCVIAALYPLSLVFVALLESSYIGLD